MKKLAGTAFAAALAGSFMLVGCGGDPCADLPRPSQAERSAASQGAEVETEVEGALGDVDCVVDGNRWVQEDD